jgi:hypothetical protein
MNMQPNTPLPAAEVAYVAAGIDRLIGLIRWLSPGGISLTAAATLSTLERAGPHDGRVVHVTITEAGREFIAARRVVRTQRLAVLLGELNPADQVALAAAVPAMKALASAQRADQPAAASSSGQH